MRTVDATLTAGIAAGTGKPYLKAYIGYSDGTVKSSHTDLWAYKLTGTTLELWVPSISNIASDQEQIWLERGLTINGTNYTVTTGRFWIWDEEYLPNRVTHYRAGIVPNEYYSAAGDVSYETAIDAFFAAFGKTTTYKNPAEAWLAYKFLPAGQFIIMNRAIRFLNMLGQKRLITICDNGAEDVRIYSADVLGAADVTIPVKDEFALFTTKQRSRTYIWKDEAQSLHTDGAATDPLHNLGYLESTDTPPARNTSSYEFEALVLPDLRIQDGDAVKVQLYNASVSVTFFAQVTEEYDRNATRLPKWRLRLQANPIFETTEGGALPSTIERVANYTPLSTTTFDGTLGPSDNNLQAAMNTIDDHTRYKLTVDRTYYVRKEVGACTISNGSPAVVTLNGHGLANGDPVVFRTTGALPTGLTPGTVYYVINSAANTFNVAATVNGAAINTSSAGSGTHYGATGNDTNDGLSQTRTHAFLTIQHAYDVCSAIDFGAQAVTIQLADSQYNEDVAIDTGCNGPLTIQGNAGTPANVIVNANGSCFRPSIVLAFSLTIKDLKVIAGSAGIDHAGIGIVYFSNIDFGACTNYHIIASGLGAIIQCTGNYSITGSASIHWCCINGGNIMASIKTITLTGTPAWGGGMAVVAQGLGLIRCEGNNFSGGATGKRYSVDSNGVIFTNGALATYLPGNAAGTTATGGLYL